MDDLVDRYLLGIIKGTVGIHHHARIINHLAIEDDCASSGELGLAGFAVDEQEPCEAQARGFTHGHRKVYGIPEPIGPEMLREFQSISAAKPDADERASILKDFLLKVSEALVRCAITLQYEAATLHARQMKQEVPAEKFTARQQQLSRLDGGIEIDGTARDLLEPTPDEPLGHIAREQDAAVQSNRPVRNAYRDVPLTGCHNSLLPLYRQPHLAFRSFPMLDEYGCHSRTEDVSAVLQSLPTPLPWDINEKGEVVAATCPEG